MDEGIRSTVEVKQELPLADVNDVPAQTPATVAALPGLEYLWAALIFSHGGLVAYLAASLAASLATSLAASPAASPATSSAALDQASTSSEPCDASPLLCGVLPVLLDLHVLLGLPVSCAPYSTPKPSDALPLLRPQRRVHLYVASSPASSLSLSNLRPSTPPQHTAGMRYGLSANVCRA
jgi:hypothetical protein